MKRKTKISLFIIAAVTGLTLVVVAYAAFLMYSPTRQPGDAQEMSFQIERGERLQSISERLFEAGLINNRIALKLAAFIHGGGSTIKAGKHKIAFGINAVEVLQLLQNSPQKEFIALTIPEGWDIFEIASEIEKTGFCNAEGILSLRSDPELLSMLDPAATSIEGYLFPDTYHIPYDFQPRQILTMMIHRSRELLDEEAKTRFAELGLTLQQGLTMASLIAKEAGNTEEMPLIASVFYNRMARGMKMECDPTFIYAAKLEGVWDGIAHRSDINRQHSYNTYLVVGLPPGPIGNPGEAAIRAALDPAETGYIFFVAKNANQKAGHYFARTLAEHNRNVRKYRNARTAAEATDQHD